MAATKSIKKPNLLDVLAGVTAQDLAEIDGQISACQRQLDMLQEARRLIDVKVNGKPAKPTGKKHKAPADAGLLARIAGALTEAGGLSIVKIAEKLGVHYQTVYKAIKTAPGFEKSADGVWGVTPDGKRLYL